MKANLDDFCANEHLKQSLLHMVESGRLFHAYLLEGENGLGKKTFARLMAASFLCTGKEDAVPCLRCESCRKVLGSVHPDVQLLEGTGSRSFHVDEIRKIRSSLYIKPNEGEYRIYILANAEGMTPQAQNALLKSLEEPPSHTIFILTTENRALLLPTILSRLVCLKLHAPDRDSCLAYFKARHPQFEEQAVLDAAELCGNNIGRMLAALSDPNHQKVMELSEQIAEALCANDSGRLLKAMAVFEKDKALFAEVLGVLQTLAHSALLAKMSAQAPIYKLERMLQERLGLSRLMRLEQLIQQTQQQMRGNANHTLMLTWLTSQLI
ncbi:ATP-binding protein [Candidatus Soleaferrea massiliensis]|uniref:DNA polymerase III subunit n=1 Tax=Candidatus Soleaferrea massiliensis TaxID=1470354 RepID=UPI0006935261|nr:DNA polymerase III subunit [Candidatus Soleaferrea massiliensis]